MAGNPQSAPKEKQSKVSAGLLLFRRSGTSLEVLLVHPGGPLFSKRDEGAWSIPKGEALPGEDLLSRAKIEFEEELGVAAAGSWFNLGSVQQKGGKTVHAWAFAGDLKDNFNLVSNAFEMAPRATARANASKRNVIGYLQCWWTQVPTHARGIAGAAFLPASPNVAVFQENGAALMPRWFAESANNHQDALIVRSVTGNPRAEALSLMASLNTTAASFYWDGRLQFPIQGKTSRSSLLMVFSLWVAPQVVPVMSRIGVDRVLKFAFELARKTPKKHLTSATKSNGIAITMPYWDERVEEMAKSFPDIKWNKFHIDILSALFVLKPDTFNVVVASNLFGDILSDLGPACTGTIGIAPSGNINPEGNFPSVFEPVHGSAPDIAGQGIANPIGMIWSGAMMLEHLGEKQAAASIVGAIERTLGERTLRTRDLGGNADTTACGKAVAEMVD
jgi:predicted NUDIX family NTP pyrophosphohydrolase